MKKKLCIAGKNLIAVEALRYVVAAFPEVEVLCLPNRGDEGLDGWQPSLRRYAESHAVKTVMIDEIYDIQDLCFVSLEYADIIKPENFATKQLYNIHFSLLPRYKGMYTSALPLLHGEERSGVTLHRIDAGIDTGEIIEQTAFDIDLSDTARDLYFKYMQAGLALFKKSIGTLIAEDFKSTPQTTAGSSYFSKKAIDYSSLSIDLRKTAFEIHNQFRAFSFREYQLPRFGDWFINRTEITNQRSSKKTGTVIKESPHSIIIATIDYDLILYKDYYDRMWAASSCNDIAAIKESLPFIDDVDLKDRNGWSALIMAAYNGSLSAANELIARGADCCGTNYKGTTVLMYAFSHYEKTKDASMFNLILNNGADRNAKDCKGKNIRDYMLERNCTDLLGYL